MAEIVRVKQQREGGRRFLPLGPSVRPLWDESVIRIAPTAVLAPDDLALAQRCVARDRSAQRALFDRELRRVHTVLFRILGSNAAIDDLVQDAFLEIFRSLKNFRGDAALGTWIDRCTVRVAYGYLKSKRRRPPALEIVPDIPSGDPSAEARAMAREAARRLYAELERIDPVRRLAFTLHVIDGRSLVEVAHLMEASLVATKTRVWRARRVLEARARRDPLLADFIGIDAKSEEPG